MEVVNEKKREQTIKEKTHLTQMANLNLLNETKLRKQHSNHPHTKKLEQENAGKIYKTVKLPHVVADEYDPEGMNLIKYKQMKEHLDAQINSIRQRDQNSLFMEMTDEEILLNYENFKKMGLL